MERVCAKTFPDDPIGGHTPVVSDGVSAAAFVVWADGHKRIAACRLDGTENATVYRPPGSYAGLVSECGSHVVSFWKYVPGAGASAAYKKKHPPYFGVTVSPMLWSPPKADPKAAPPVDEMQFAAEIPVATYERVWKIGPRRIVVQCKDSCLVQMSFGRRQTVPPPACVAFDICGPLLVALDSEFLRFYRINPVSADARDSWLVHFASVFVGVGGTGVAFMKDGEHVVVGALRGFESVRVQKVPRE